MVAIVLIRKLDGTEYDLDDVEIRTRDLIIQSPVPEHHFESVEGQKGVIDYGTTYGPREIKGFFRAKSATMATFSLLRDEIFAHLCSGEAFYLIEKRIQGKQWLVKVKDTFDVPQRNVYGDFDITFIALKGFSESKATTQEIQKNGILAGENWSYGMGLETATPNNQELMYTHNAVKGTRFKIFNAGNVEVHPFESYLKIDIKNVTGSTKQFRLINRTNNTNITIKIPVAKSDVWIVDGAVVKRNSLLAAKDTNHQFIQLEPRWNEFEILDCDSATISFDFKFLYR